MGARVVGVSLEPPTDPNLYQQARVAEDMVGLLADIRDLNKIKNL
jgi:CDP-glucose 4,6-dehydratase